MDFDSYRPICQGGKEAFGLFERSVCIICEIERVVLTTGTLQRKLPRSGFPCVKARAFISEFSLNLGFDAGPKASACPAVLGDVNPCWRCILIV